MRYPLAAGVPVRSEPFELYSRMSDSKRVEVYEYIDSRRYLEAHFARMKAQRSGFSYRGFARLANLKSPNYLALVIQGKRNLSEAMAVRFARACGLEGDRAAFFLDLVRFTQASSSGERERAYARMLSFLGYRRVHALETATAQYHAHWYIPAVRELAARSDFKLDPAWIAKTLVPSITKTRAKRALDVLLGLGLLVKDETGRAIRGTTLVSTGEQTHSVHMSRFHREMIDCAISALDEMSAQEREISSVTLCMGEEGLLKLKEATRAFRRKLLALEELEEDPKQVFQVNLQVFPLSRSVESLDLTVQVGGTGGRDA